MPGEVALEYTPDLIDRTGVRRMVELRVAEDGRDFLIYTFRGTDEAAEMMRFLAEFLPDARFLIQPLRH